VANLASLGSNFISTTGNIIGNFFVGDGSRLTNIVANYGNANVVANLAALGSNPISTGGNITTSAALSAGGISTSGAIAAVSVGASGNVTGGNVRTAGQVSAGGNITGSYFLGNGSQLTGIVTPGPIVLAYNSAKQNLSTGATALAYTTTTVNTSNYYNTTTGLFTPLIAGYYQVNLTAAPELYGVGAGNATFQLGLYKNGTIIAISPTISITQLSYILSSNSISALVYLDGVSDFIQAAYISTIVSGSWRTAVNGVTCYFQAVWVRG
jgi:hypothetical protein